MNEVLFRQLILAILAMDSYNRGYARGLKFSADESSANRNEAGSEIGDAVVRDVPLPAGSEATSFYGIAYDMSGVEGFAEGETVIAYRGTDKNGLGVDSETGGSDLTNGYGLAGYAHVANDNVLPQRTAA